MMAKKFKPNRYIFINDTIEIELTQGQTCLIDASDYDLVKDYKWYYHKQKHANSGYVVTHISNNGKQKLLYIHRFIMNFDEKGLDIDHINRNGTDNRRCNLRICTHQENQMNKTKQKNNKAGYKGVSFHKRSNKYVAQIKFTNKVIYLGLFEDPISAARAYDEKAKELYGEFAVINF